MDVMQLRLDTLALVMRHAPTATTEEVATAAEKLMNFVLGHHTDSNAKAERKAMRVQTEIKKRQPAKRK